MKVTSVIEEEEVVKKILKNLGLWDREYSIDYSMSQLLCFHDLVSDEAGSEFDKWLYVDQQYR